MQQKKSGECLSAVFISPTNAKYDECVLYVIKANLGTKVRTRNNYIYAP